ncbi:MAG: aldehyde ferredoxin oxidoreductase family protein, partial [Mycobacterium leprae]
MANLMTLKPPAPRGTIPLTERGYAGRVLHIDLTAGTSGVEATPEDAAHLLLGGKGLALWLLHRDQPACVEPLSPENHLIFAVGPLTGTTAATSGRFSVVTRSPLTGAVLDSSCGGHFANQLKHAGYDALSVVGACASPSILVIDGDAVRLEPAGDLWGEQTFEAGRRLKARFGPDSESAHIGPAGERLLPIAGIVSGSRMAARGGPGAVMGSKNLKAVVVRGQRNFGVYDLAGFQEGVKLSARALRMSTGIKRVTQEGSANILEFVQASGALPTRNFQRGQFESAEALTGSKWRETLWQNQVACWGCPISCGKLAVVTEGKYAGTKVDGPEYETVFAFGPNCGVADRCAIAYANLVCDRAGVDTISAGGIVGFVMELYEHGMLTAEDLDGIEPRWGDADAMVALTEKLAYGEGAGRWLATGVRAIAARFPGSAAFAMHAKGMELPAYHPRGAKGVALGYAVSARGGCHLHGATIGELLGGTDPLAQQGKARLVKDKQAEAAVINAAIICYFTDFGQTLKEIYQLVAPCTGWDYGGVQGLEEVGDRIATLHKLLNLREGLTRLDDTLPSRVLHEPEP